MSENCSLLEIRSLTASYHRNGEEFPVLDDVSFAIEKGKSLGVVGESGSGKSTIAKCIVQLLPLSSGQMLWQGRDIAQFDKSEAKNLKIEMQMIFQDPGGSLNPYMKSGAIISEPLLVHGRLNRKERENETKKLLEQVGLQASDAQKYPHEFSGGQKQRIALSLALVRKPEILILDEVTSALDSETEHEIQDALDRAGRGRTVLMIAHRLSTVAKADSIIVLEEGRVVERGDHETLLARKGRYHDLWTLQQSEKTTAA